MQITSRNKPPVPVHVPGIAKGEEYSIKEGKEPGRGCGPNQYRSARDATSINSKLRNPILSSMPDIPPN